MSMFPYIVLHYFTTFDIVEKHPDKPWDWFILSRNENMLMSKSDEIKMYRQYFASKRIQRKWKICISNPSYKICKKRLMREFNETLVEFPH